MIPQMTHELSQYWHQPDRENIETDDTHALMMPEDFCLLSDYSHSLPSGVYPGKMWKLKHKGDWVLAWYSDSGNPNHCDINYRTILLT